MAFHAARSAFLSEFLGGSILRWLTAVAWVRGDKRSSGRTESEAMKRESDLEEALLGLYREWADLGYRANRFYQMITPHCKRYVGGISTVQRLLSRDSSGGFAFLRDQGKLDLTVEALVAGGEWNDLFSSIERARAREKLSW
jgi:hypothetical protein